MGFGDLGLGVLGFRVWGFGSYGLSFRVDRVLLGLGQAFSSSL